MTQKIIEKIKLINFKRFKNTEISFSPDMNLLIGDNEAGKSSILTAIYIVLSGSKTKVETVGLESLFNTETIEDFLQSNKSYDKLPKMEIELYFNEQHNYELSGKVNSEDKECDGLRLICEPDDDLSSEIMEVLEQRDFNFPFEYYKIGFKTFSGQSYTGFKKFLKYIFIDNTQINNEYATKQYIKSIYNSIAENTEKNKHKNEYRKYKTNFCNDILGDLNERISDYSFSIKNNSKANLETDLTITESNIDIENRGKGRQCFIKTEFALKEKETDLDIILMEEPENHLSHLNMKKLVNRISETQQRQIFITTHNSLISTRLDLRKSILLNSNSEKGLVLDELTRDTAKFFMKAPDNNILEFILSKKVILVEGDAEYILMEQFYKNVTSEELNNSEIHIISVGGTSFKRYLEIAKILKIKTAIIRDNDGDYHENCVKNYKDFVDEKIKVFADNDNEKKTFEIVMYNENKNICDELWGKSRKTLSVQDYMLNNKANAAFELLDKKENDIKVPNYIKQAILWIKK